VSSWRAISQLGEPVSTCASTARSSELSVSAAQLGAALTGQCALGGALGSGGHGGPRVLGGLAAVGLGEGEVLVAPRGGHGAGQPARDAQVGEVAEARAGVGAESRTALAKAMRASWAASSWSPPGR